jgi:hypothetical protein
MPKPSIGRIVHYVSYGTPGGEYQSECRAAIITEVDDRPYATVGSGGNPIDPDEAPIGLAVLNPSGMFFNEAMQDEETKSGGTWHWPERVEEA